MAILLRARFLLILDVFVGGQEQFEASFFRCPQQLAVTEFVPALLEGSPNRVAFKI
jgi:hypothetical protein